MSKEHKTTKIESDFITLEPGQSVQGYIKKDRPITFPGKNGNPPSVVGKYALLDDDDKTKTILGATKLDQLLDDVQDGTWVVITRNKDLKTSSGNKLKDYTLEVEE